MLMVSSLYDDSWQAIKESSLPCAFVRSVEKMKRTEISRRPLRADPRQLALAVKGSKYPKDSVN